MIHAEKLSGGLKSGDFRALARCISLVENAVPGYEAILAGLHIDTTIPVVGITGPPGAGKSTLVNSLITSLNTKEYMIGVIAIDPTSPFNYGSLLGDRIRMSEHFLDKNVYIRSLATRGVLGGVSAKTVEIADLMRAAGFDIILIETVGVGQSEVEIAGLADTSVVVLVPEAGDEIQGIKSGLMEIADVFVVNKADREGAGFFANNIQKIIRTQHKEGWTAPVIQTVASKGLGTDELIKAIEQHSQYQKNPEKKVSLLAEKAYQLIRDIRMKDVDKQGLKEKLAMEFSSPGFNLYAFVNAYR